MDTLQKHMVAETIRYHFGRFASYKTECRGPDCVCFVKVGDKSYTVVVDLITCEVLSIV